MAASSRPPYWGGQDPLVNKETVLRDADISIKIECNSEPIFFKLFFLKTLGLKEILVTWNYFSTLVTGGGSNQLNAKT